MDEVGDACTVTNVTTVLGLLVVTLVLSDSSSESSSESSSSVVEPLSTIAAGVGVMVDAEVRVELVFSVVDVVTAVDEGLRVSERTDGNPP